MHGYLYGKVIDVSIFPRCFGAGSDARGYLDLHDLVFHGETSTSVSDKILCRDGGRACRVMKQRGIKEAVSLRIPKESIPNLGRLKYRGNFQQNNGLDGFHNGSLFANMVLSCALLACQMIPTTKLRAPTRSTSGPRSRLSQLVESKK